MEDLSQENKIVKIKGLKGKNLVFFLLGIFIIFSAVGAGIGYVIAGDSPSSPSDDYNNRNEPSVNSPVPDVMLEGRIVFVEPQLYPEDDLSYALVNAKGDREILLKAFDEKLVVSEGHFAKVYGKKIKTVSGKEDILVVNKIVIDNNLNK